MELEDRYPDEAAEAAWASQEEEPPARDPLAYGLSLARAETSAVDDELTRLRMGILDAEHRLRLLADRTDDYGPEGMRTRLVAEYQKLAHLAWTPDKPDKEKP
jgi:hypothetical protein